jgi:hypothetical protein
VRKSRAILAGLLIAFIAEALALGLSGGGEGWNTPIKVSLVLWVTYPVVLARLRLSPSDRLMTVEIALLLAGLASDIALVLLTINEGLQYPRGFIAINGVFGVLWMGAWIAIWLTWQAVAGLNLARARRQLARG